MWVRTYGGDRPDACQAMLALDDGGLLLVGETSSDVRYPDALYVVRTDEDGEELWSITLSYFFGAPGYDVLPTEDGGYLIAGYRYDGREHGGRNFLLIKTAPDPVSAPRLFDPTFPSRFAMSAPYPNPFNATVTIPYQLPEFGAVTLKIINASGREVATLINSQQTAGYHQAVWHSGNVPSGIYFFQMEAQQHTKVQKLMLIK